MGSLQQAHKNLEKEHTNSVSKKIPPGSLEKITQFYQKNFESKATNEDIQFGATFLLLF